MRVLLDNNVDHRFARLLIGHDVVHARHMGWKDLFNGDLISAAESAGFAMTITADKGIRYQQNLRSRTISVITLDSIVVDLPAITPPLPQVLAVLEKLPQGRFLTISP